MGELTAILPAITLSILLVGCASTGSEGHLEPGKKQSLKEWHRLTVESVRNPRVFVDHEQIRFYFYPQTNRPVEFRAKLTRLRLPSEEYQINSAPLLLRRKASPMPIAEHHWREARVISAEEWHQLATNLVATLTPASPGHGAYYRALFGDRFLFRDAAGNARFAPLNQPPPGVNIQHRYSIEESLQIVARWFSERLTHDYPHDSAFVVMAPDSRHFPQPLLIDRAHLQCVWLSPVDFYRSTEPGHVLSGSARGIRTLIFETYCLALIKNPVSSAVRLVNLLVETGINLVRLPLPGPAKEIPAVTPRPGMDLTKWETWLNHHTRTHPSRGSIGLIVDGEQFFPKLQSAIDHATNHVHVDVFIFDNDDVAVGIADRLRARSHQIQTHVILDRLGSIAAALVPPATHPPTNFSAPPSISAYLKQDSNVKVRPFLNPFLSYDHSKVYLVDGNQAWLGGMNIGREYRYEWHDMMVKVEGSVVDALENDFRLDWAHASLAGDLAYLAALLHRPVRTVAIPGTNSWTSLRLLPTKTTWKPFNTAVLGALRQAQSYIYLENAYLFDKRVITGLVLARARGVDVRVVLPRSNDSRTARHAELVIANYLLEHGVGVYFYPGMSHVKALLVDDWACVGSSNLNQFGLRLCQEHNVATSDPVFARTLKHDIFEADFDRSFQLTAPVSVAWADWLADIVVEGF